MKRRLKERRKILECKALFKYISQECGVGYLLKGQGRMAFWKARWFRRNRCRAIGFLGMVCCIVLCCKREKMHRKGQIFIPFGSLHLGGAGRDMHASVFNMIPSFCLLQQDHHSSPTIDSELRRAEQVNNPPSIDTALAFFWLIFQIHRSKDRIRFKVEEKRESTHHTKQRNGRKLNEGKRTVPLSQA